MILSYANNVLPEGGPNAILKTMFPFDAIDGGKTRFGIITIPPGARIPVVGLAPHDEDEYCIVVSGSMVVTVAENEYRVSVGDATLIPSGEAHASHNDGDEECVVVWALVKRL
ncbi:cupin domain-containing protein [Brevibacillus fluminis]|uniref:Cupin domain-containing protein n=1 Tax=Brevibacillus fluminis TaxID=511487 RepID=A0A3M8DD13_9BACL|nr:cupin domain-containing protein [Brevibacillus fluminis]RNB85471.1 cupin domain-containing protein [Brevibacillus fluminis]